MATSDDEKSLISLKILMLGESGVGKSSLISRFVSNRFNLFQPATVGVDFRSTDIQRGFQRVKVNFYDSAGQERFRSVPPIYFRFADAAIFVYDITNDESFKKISYWLEEFHRHDSADTAVKMLIGNKTDRQKERKVTTAEGAGLAQQSDMIFMETSAATAEQIREAFDAVIEMAVEMTNLWGLEQSDTDESIPTSNPALKLESTMSGRKRNCC